MCSQTDEECCLPIFTYGTLRPNQPNYCLFEGRIEAEQPAYIEGARLFCLGAYPMAIQDCPPDISRATFDQMSNRIYGDLIYPAQNCYHNLLRKLDQLEGFNPQNPQISLYWRIQRSVILYDGSQTQAWFYLGNPQYLRPWHDPIFNGDWVAYIGAPVFAT